jgi:magnesium-transporting ATPase (P-type)
LHSRFRICEHFHLASTAKDLDEGAYASWAARYKSACTSSTNRADKVAEVCEELETGLTLLGATAVEDKLQVRVCVANLCVHMS